MHYPLPNGHSQPCLSPGSSPRAETPNGSPKALCSLLSSETLLVSQQGTDFHKKTTGNLSLYIVSLSLTQETSLSLYLYSLFSLTQETSLSLYLYSLSLYLYSLSLSFYSSISLSLSLSILLSLSLFLFFSLSLSPSLSSLSLVSVYSLCTLYSCFCFALFSKDFRGSADRKSLPLSGVPCFSCKKKSKDWRVRAEKKPLAAGKNPRQKSAARVFRVFYVRALSSPRLCQSLRPPFFAHS